MLGRRGLRKRARRGFALIETLLALGIGAMMMVAGAYLYNERLDDMRDKVAAEQLRQVSDAANRYIRDNYQTVAGLTGPVGGAGYRISQATLQSAGYLPSGFQRGAYGDSFEVLVRATPTGLEALVVAGGGTRPIAVRRAPMIGAAAGAAGGYVTDAGIVQGAYGGYRVPLANFPAASVGTPRLASLLDFTASEITTDYLYRVEVAGHPEVNRMNVDLDMATHNINAVKTLTTETVTGPALVITSQNGVVTIGRSDAATDLSVHGKLATTGDAEIGGALTTAGNLTVGGENGTADIKAREIYSDYMESSLARANQMRASEMYAQAFYYDSDRRLKENIVPLEGQLDRLLQLRGVSFDWKESGQHEVGLIAQDVAKAYPELVATNPTTGTLSVKYGNLVGPIIEAIRQLREEQDTLKTAIGENAAAAGNRVASRPHESVAALPH